MTVKIYLAEGIKVRFKIILSNATYEWFKAFLFFNSYIDKKKMFYRFATHVARITVWLDGPKS